MKTNYHIHNERCGHAIGRVEDYAKAGYEAGYDIIGMSDHGPFPDCEFASRMPFSELKDYIADVTELKNVYSKKMDIKLALEIEYIEQEEEYYNELLEKYGMEYLILGQHFFNKQDKSLRYVYDMPSTDEYIEYAMSVEKALSKGYFSFVAHPDFMFVHNYKWDDNCTKASDIIINAAVKYNIPLELNGNGVRRGITKFLDGERYQYPHYRFFEMVSQAKVPVIVNADCHSPEQIDDKAMQRARELVSEWNLILKETL